MTIFFGSLAYGLLPTAILLFFLVSLPLPNWIRVYITWFTDKVLLFKIHAIVAKVSLIWLVILVSVGTLTSAMITASAKSGEVSSAQLAGLPAAHPRALKWRAERNAWLAAFNLFAWLALWAHCAAVAALAAPPTPAPVAATPSSPAVAGQAAAVMDEGAATPQDEPMPAAGAAHHDDD